MFVVRVNHKNGLYVEFLFMDLGRADQCAQTCAAAKLRGNSHPPKDAACEVTDDAGRQTWLDGTQMQAVQLAPIEEEVRFNTRLRVVAQLTAEAWLRDTGLADHPTVGLGNGHAASPAQPQQRLQPEGAAAIGLAPPPTFSN